MKYKKFVYFCPTQLNKTAMKTTKETAAIISAALIFGLIVLITYFNNN